MVDRYTKMAKYILVKGTITVDELAEFFINRIISYFGMFNSVVSDRDSLFISKF